MVAAAVAAAAVVVVGKHAFVAGVDAGGVRKSFVGYLPLLFETFKAFEYFIFYNLQGKKEQNLSEQCKINANTVVFFFSFLFQFM